MFCQEKALNTSGDSCFINHSSCAEKGNYRLEDQSILFTLLEFFIFVGFEEGNYFGRDINHKNNVVGHVYSVADHLEMLGSTIKVETHIETSKHDKEIACMVNNF